MEPIDYSPLDVPQIAEVMFYPQRVWSPCPNGASDHLVPVAEGVSISARFYPHRKDAPTILFFHGNGEVACDYDPIAGQYHQAGANFLVADYRGYGRSGGIPSFPSMVADARAVYRWSRDFLASEGYGGPRFVKGRSLGCHSAVEVAASFQGELRGLVSESGSSAVDRTVVRFGLSPADPAVQAMVRAHRRKVASITLPFLMIHGERDELIPLQTAMDLYRSIGSRDKTLEVIPQAGHNDILYVGMEQYFAAMRKFLAEHGAPP